MKIKNKKIVVSEEGSRIDLFLTDYFNIKRSLVQKNIKEQKVLLNNKEVKKNHILKINDNIQLKDFLLEEENVINKVDKDIDILYEDNDLLVVYKPKNLVVYPGVGKEEDSLLARLLNKYNNLSQVDPKRPGIVHRLDKGTDGLLIIAKTNKAHELLKKDFQNRKIKKTYFALCKGKFKNLKDEITLPIGKDLNNPTKQKITPDGKSAITRYEVISQDQDLSFVKINLITGRTHQIRVHMAYIGHPLIGDLKYSSNKKEFKNKGFFLTAKILEFNHPVTKKQVKIECDFSSELKEIIKKLKKVTDVTISN